MNREKNTSVREELTRIRGKIEDHRDGCPEAMVPLYLSNHCDGECRICAMRRTNTRLKRREGSLAEIRGQLDIVLRIEGVSAVGLLTGEFSSPTLRKRNLLTVVETVQEAFAMGFEKVYVNIGALDDSEISEFSQRFNGDASLVLCVFQETYDRSLYARFFGTDPHASPKSDFRLRRTTLGRWIEHGFNQVNVGILLGLGPPQFDVDSVIMHARELAEAGAMVSISVPRLRGVPAVPYFVSDHEFKQVVLTIAEACPWARLVLTTRETVPLIKELLPVIGVVSPGTSDVLAYRPEGPLPNDPETSQFYVTPRRLRPSWVLQELADGKTGIRYSRAHVH